MKAGVALQLERLAARNQSMSAEVDPSKRGRLLDFFVRIIPQLIDSERCSIFIHDPEGKKTWLKVGTNVDERGIEVSLEDSVVGEVISTGKPIIARDLERREGAHKDVDATTEFKTREVLCVPVRSQLRDEIIGAIEVLNKSSEGGFTAEDQAQLEEFAYHLEQMIDSVFLGQEVYGVTKIALDAASATVKVAVTIAVLAVLAIAVLIGGYALWPMLMSS